MGKVTVFCLIFVTVQADRVFQFTGRDYFDEIRDFFHPRNGLGSLFRNDGKFKNPPYPDDEIRDFFHPRNGLENLVRNEAQFEHRPYQKDLSNFEDLYRRNALNIESLFRNGGKVCGDIICVEKVEEVATEVNLIIPNTRNVTCDTCYNMITRKYVDPVNQKRDVLVFEKMSDACHRLKKTLTINDGCKCSQEAN